MLLVYVSYTFASGIRVVCELFIVYMWCRVLSVFDRCCACVVSVTCRDVSGRPDKRTRGLKRWEQKKDCGPFPPVKSEPQLLL